MKISLLLQVLILCIMIHSSCTKRENPGRGIPQRIISFAPSITETLFALGLGEKVIGVTTYCKYPPEVRNIEKVGGYSEINLEKVISLRPDLVILQEEHRRQIDFLSSFGIPVLTVKSGNCLSICSSMVRIGNACGVRSKADSLADAFRNRLHPVLSERYKPKILLCIGRDSPGNGKIEGIFAAGESTFYTDLIRAAGGVNAFRDSVPLYPKISREGIISLAPDIVIDVASSMGCSACSTLVSDWKTMTMLAAVRMDHVFCISADYTTVPGPRAVLLLDDFVKIVQSYFTDTTKESGS